MSNPVINFIQNPAFDVNKWLDSFDTVLTDCDGVLWIYNDVLEGTPEVINKLRDLGKKIYFVTNNSTKTREEFVEKINRLGFKTELNEIISTAFLAASYLQRRNFNKKVYIVGSSGISKELDAVGISHIGVGPDTINCNLQDFVKNELKDDKNIGAVIVGFDEHFSFPKMARAASYLNDPNCIFLATNTDERFPMPNKIIPGTGSFIKAIEVCAERDAIVLGKPNRSVCENLLEDNIITASRTLVIGDRCNTDILLGKNCGFQTLLVGTGVHKIECVQNWIDNGTSEQKKMIPDSYIPSLGDLLNLL